MEGLGESNVGCIDWEFNLGFGELGKVIVVDVGLIDGDLELFWDLWG